MKIIKGNIKFSDLPKGEKISEIKLDAIHWKEIFKMKRRGKTVLIKIMKNRQKWF